jgi:hypothetical protein
LGGSQWLQAKHALLHHSKLILITTMDRAWGMPTLTVQLIAAHNAHSSMDANTSRSPMECVGSRATTVASGANLVQHLAEQRLHRLRRLHRLHRHHHHPLWWTSWKKSMLPCKTILAEALSPKHLFSQLTTQTNS